MVVPMPRCERLPLLACSYVGTKFPDRVPQDQVLLRAFLGGVRSPGVLRHDDESLASLAHRCLSGLLQIRGTPQWYRAFRFPRSMPQYEVGYKSRIQGIRTGAERHPGLVVCGGALGAVGLPDCIAAGAQAATLAMEAAARVRRPVLAAQA